MATGLPERVVEWLSSILGSTARVQEIAVLPDTSYANHRLRIQPPTAPSSTCSCADTPTPSCSPPIRGTRPPTR